MNYDKFSKDKLEKEIDEFAFEIPDGFYKGCLVYHEAIKTFIIKALKEQKEDFIKMLPEEMLSNPSIKSELYLGAMVGHNNCLKEIKNKINKLTPL